MSFERPKAEVDFFADYIVPPCASYADTLVVFHGWDIHEALDQADLMLGYSQDMYREFGGQAHDIMLPLVTYEEVVDKLETSRPLYAFGEIEKIAKLTHKYLIGEGEDYPAYTHC